MLIETIQMKNFRSIKEITIRCGSVTVFLGGNNHGKSNILAALDFFCGTGSKCESDNFFKTKETSTSELWVEICFINLSDQEKNTFKKYVSANGKLKVRKIATIDKSGKVDINYHGWLSEPTIQWLKPDYSSTKRADLEATLVNFLPEGVRYSKTAVEAAQEAYIAQNVSELEFEYLLESANFLGRANVATGVLPDAFLVPAVRELNEETKTKNTTLFGRLLNRAMGEMAEADEGFRQVKTDLATIVRRLNKQEGEDDSRPIQLREIESNLEKELIDWNVKLNINISAPEIEKIFELGTSLDVDDGVITPAEEKGHGLQRALIFALTRSWANALRKQQEGTDVTPRGASESVFLLIEEPELYLHPHAQKALSRNLREIAKTPHHQVFITTHSTHFIDISSYRDIAVIYKDAESKATNALQSDIDLFGGEDNKSRKNRFNIGHWVNPDRAELFFARKVVFVEGPTEKVLFPYIAEKIGVYDVGVSIIDCGSKFNLPVYIELAGSFGFGHIAVHDEDPIKEGLEGDKLAEATRTFGINNELNELSKRTNTILEVIKPNFEEAFGISKSQGEKLGKPLAALNHFDAMKIEEYPTAVIELVKNIYS